MHGELCAGAAFIHSVFIHGWPALRVGQGSMTLSDSSGQLSECALYRLEKILAFLTGQSLSPWRLKLFYHVHTNIKGFHLLAFRAISCRSSLLVNIFWRKHNIRCIYRCLNGFSYPPSLVFRSSLYVYIFNWHQ